MSFLEDLGTGLRGAGGVLSPQVYKEQNVERERQLPNLLLATQVQEQVRKMKADETFRNILASKTSSAPITGASSLRDAMKDVPVELIAASPMAEKMSNMASQFQAREDQAQARFYAIEERRREADMRSEDKRLSLAEQGRARAEANELRLQIAQMVDTTRRAGINLRNEGKLTPEAVNNEAMYSIINGKIRPGAVAWGVSGNADRTAITNRIAEIATEYGIPPEKLASLGLTNRAKASALLQLEKQRNAVQAYERSFIAQVDVLDQLSDNVARTASSWVNRPLNELRRSGMGSPDVAEFVAQMRLVQTEAARIIANPNLTGQLTDTAREEIRHVIDGSMTPAQVKRVAARLKTDARLRHEGLDDQAASLGAEITGSTVMPAAPTATTPAPGAPAAPKQSDPLEYKGYKFPNQEALDNFKAAGG